MAPAEPTTLSLLRPIRVLVLSPDTRFVGAVRFLLDRRAFAVRTADRPEGVPDLVARASDVVVVDVTQRRSDGAAAVEAVRCRWPGVDPVVVCDDASAATGAVPKWGPPHQLLRAIEGAYHRSGPRRRAIAPGTDAEWDPAAPAGR